MRQTIHWVLPLVALMAVVSGCASTQQATQTNLFGGVSGRNAEATTPAQLASYQADPVAAGRYPARLAAASRPAPASKRFQTPKCLSAG